MHKPTDPAERIEQIDVLRGFALFGVLLVNVFGYNSSFFDFSGFYAGFEDSLNSTIFTLMVNYGADKFIGLFSLLFGMGFGIMYVKYREMDGFFLRMYTRRLLALLLFGIIHVAFFWAGDILISYALVGFILLAFRKTRSGILLPLAIFMYFVPILYIGFCAHFPALPDSMSSTSQLSLSEVIQTYSEGTFAEVFKLRLHEYWSFRNINLIYYGPKIFALFFAGYLFYKHRILDRINASGGRALILAIFLLIIGILLNHFTGDLVNAIVRPEHPYFSALYMGIYEVTNLFLIAAYVLLIVTLTHLKQTRKFFSGLRFAGRMTLTNYLSYSVIFSFLMYSYGFGLFGRFEPWELILMAVGLFAIQLLACRLWLKKHRFGPMEWVWRRLTYSPIAKIPETVR